MISFEKPFKRKFRSMKNDQFDALVIVQSGGSRNVTQAGAIKLHRGAIRCLKMQKSIKVKGVARQATRRKYDRFDRIFNRGLVLR